MAVLDGYSESNHDYDLNIGALDLGNATYPGASQSFNSGLGGNIDLSKFYLAKVGSPTGNANARIYAHSGTFGSDSKPTGTALAVSDNFDVSVLTGSFTLNSLLFSGGNRINLPPSTNYCATFEYSGGNSANYLLIGMDASSPTHGGNSAILIAGIWTENFRDLIFSVEGTLAVPMRRGGMFAALV